MTAFDPTRALELAGLHEGQGRREIKWSECQALIDMLRAAVAKVWELEGYVEIAERTCEGLNDEAEVRATAFRELEAERDALVSEVERLRAVNALLVAVTEDARDLVKAMGGECRESMGDEKLRCLFDVIDDLAAYDAWRAVRDAKEGT